MILAAVAFKAEEFYVPHRVAGILLSRLIWIVLLAILMLVPELYKRLITLIIKIFGESRKGHW